MKMIKKVLAQALSLVFLVRNRFLQQFLNQDEEKYTAYWTVRRYIGKGAPTGLACAADVINYVQSTPGALGFIDESS